MTARSVDASVPTTLAGYVAPPEKPTRTFDASWTTWSFVTMSPCRSTTNPEPPICTFWELGGAKKLPGTFTFSVAEMTTTLGAAFL